MLDLTVWESEVYVSYLAHKKKCTSQPQAITALEKHKCIGGYCVVAQTQNESPNSHTCIY